MKHTIISLAITIVAAVAMTPAAAQKDYKFGKVTKAELLRTDFPDIADGAKVIVLDEIVEAHMTAESVPTREAYVYKFMRYMESFCTTKYKIVTTQGSHNAKITITFAVNEYPDTGRMKARLYMLRDNRISKRDVSFKEAEQTTLADGTRCITFALPDAADGDIFECSFVKLVNLSKAEAYDLPMQREIPVLNIKYSLSAPFWHPNNSIVVNDRTIVKERRTSGPVTFTMNPWNGDVEPTMALIDMKHNVRRKYHSRISDIHIYEAGNIPALGSSDAEAIRVRLVLDPKEYETYESGDKKVVVK